MSELEFVKVMEKFGVKQFRPDLALNVRFYEWNGFTAYFAYDMIDIRGKDFPEEVVTRLDQNYPKKYGIMPNYPSNDSNIDSEKISWYKFNTKEGFLAFIVEMLDYELRKEGKPEEHVEKFAEYLRGINIELLEDIDPEVSACDWVRFMEGRQPLYEQALYKTSTTDEGKLLRNAIDGFDKAVCPFISNSVEDVVDELPQDAMVEIFKTTDWLYSIMSRDGSVTYKKDGGFTITFANGDKITCKRGRYGFTFELIQRNENGKETSISHSYNCNEEKELGEIITIKNENGKIWYNTNVDKIYPSSETALNNMTRITELLEIATNDAQSLMAGQFEISRQSKVTKQ